MRFSEIRDGEQNPHVSLERAHLLSFRDANDDASFVVEINARVYFLLLRALSLYDFAKPHVPWSSGADRIGSSLVGELHPCFPHGAELVVPRR